MRKSNELQIGKAGEYLVCADLCMRGYIAFLSEQGLPYDVLLDNGKRLLKIQVKTTTQPREVPQRNKVTKAYMFSVKRHGKTNNKRYADDEIDIFALVCLDTKMIGYLKNGDMPDSINLRVDSMRGEYYDEIGIKMYDEVLKLKGTLNQSQIAKKLGKSLTTVHYMIQDGYIPFETKARYFSDLTRTDNWFYDFT